jgi:hypothetical protein
MWVRGGTFQPFDTVSAKVLRLGRTGHVPEVGGKEVWRRQRMQGRGRRGKSGTEVPADLGSRQGVTESYWPCTRPPWGMDGE